MGLKVYRELIDNEQNAPFKWDNNWGAEVQRNGVPSHKLMRVNGLENAVAMKVPPAMQLFHLQRERRRIAGEARQWEQTNLPRSSVLPISQPSVDIWGDKAYTQRPNAERRERPATAPVTSSKGPPHSRGLPNQTMPRRLYNKWSVEHEYFHREPVGAVHQRAAAAWA